MPSTKQTNPQPKFVDVFETRFIAGALRRHGVIVLIAVVIGVLAGVGFSWMSQPMYRTEAVLLVNIQSLKIGADGVPMDVELVLPARRLVGTVCNSDRAMTRLAKRLDGDVESDGGAELSKRIAWLRSRLYYDQRGLEMAALRATAADAQEAARLANQWALVSQELLRESYGTTVKHIQAAETRIDSVQVEVLHARRALDELQAGASDARRLELQDTLDRYERLLGELNQRHAELTVRLEDSQEIARIVSPATPPAQSINPSGRLIAGLFGFAGLLIGLAIALLRGPPGSLDAAPGSFGGGSH
jgi:uncharacterized protein involved in exopolysaccharide biosynthesis